MLSSKLRQPENFLVRQDTVKAVTRGKQHTLRSRIDSEVDKAGQTVVIDVTTLQKRRIDRDNGASDASFETVRLHLSSIRILFLMRPSAEGKEDHAERKQLQTLNGGAVHVRVEHNNT